MNVVPHSECIIITEEPIDPVALCEKINLIEEPSDLVGM